MGDLIIKFISSSLIIGLIFFIIGNAITTSNYKRRALIYAIVGAVLLLGSFIGYLYDVYELEMGKFSLEYFLFPISIFVIAASYTISNLIRAKKVNHHLRGYRHQQNNDLEQSLYIVFRMDNNYLFLEEEDKYRGYLFKFPKNVFFHDEALNLVLEKLNFKKVSSKLVGKVNFTRKKKTFIYYCYNVSVSFADVPNGFKAVDKLGVLQIEADQLDKELILKTIINEEFNIEK
jgi:hypothetical protein